jgi:hypothetical protein
LAVKAFSWDLRCSTCKGCICTQRKQCKSCSGCKCCKRMRRTLAVEQFRKLGMDRGKYLRGMDPDGEVPKEERGEVVRSFFEELEEAASTRDLKEAKSEVEKLVSARGTQAARGLARKKVWGCERWLRGASVGALIKFRARAGRLLRGVRYVKVGAKEEKVAIVEPCPMPNCGNTNTGEDAQRHFIVDCEEGGMREEREVIMGAGPFRRRVTKEDLYEVVLGDAFADEAIDEGVAHEQEDMVAGFLSRCWAIRRKFLQKAAQASRSSCHSSTSLAASAQARAAMEKYLGGGQQERQRRQEGLGDVGLDEGLEDDPQEPTTLTHASPHARPPQLPFTPGVPVPPHAFDPAYRAEPVGVSPRGEGSGGFQTSRQRLVVSPPGLRLMALAPMHD